ncbi:MAG: phosphate signaling complex protein PhoU [Anaerolineae bacterium]|nr:phosphate signaling complex protein PhoU [Anaerolineae bacterium]MCO5197884.1 phosphate signaling complex protein PhoU [Anaerolineae bacterium]MCO5203473.1 phosphate signaling complex protein PhoU [Anaerolineae bacterium]
MTRKLFDNELQQLGTDLLQLGADVRNALLMSVAALTTQDIAASWTLIDADKKINEQRHNLENNCLTVIATQQPMAGDLRRIATVLYIATELERIGDYAKTIAKLTVRIGDEPLVEPLANIKRMSELAMGMLDRALQAFAAEDIELARRIPADDDEIDKLYDVVFRAAMAHVRDNIAHVDQINYVIMMAYSLERTADRVINMCERIIYMVSAEIVDLDDDMPEPAA